MAIALTRRRYCFAQRPNRSSRSHSQTYCPPLSAYLGHHLRSRATSPPSPATTFAAIFCQIFYHLPSAIPGIANPVTFEHFE